MAPGAGTAGTYEVVVTATDTASPAWTATTTVSVTVQEEPVQITRVTDSLRGLYNFNESSGTTVGDSLDSGVQLTVADESAVTWNGGSLTINSPTIIQSVGPATSFVDAVKDSDEFTVEAWVTPANETQAGPARVVSLSDGTSNRNVQLAQGEAGDLGGDHWSTRQRSTATSENGTPGLSAPDGTAVAGQLTHLVLTRSQEGEVTLYINGAAMGTTTDEGSLSNWDNSFPLILANETSLDRPWLGTIHLVAVYSRALSRAEVEQNRQVGG